MNKFKTGDKVKIVKKAWHWNTEGKMDKWLGKIVTVKEVNNYGYCYIEEDVKENDGTGWSWNEECLELAESEE